MTDEELARLQAEEKAAADKAAADKKATATSGTADADLLNRGLTDEDLAARRPGVLGNARVDDPWGAPKNLASTVLHAVSELKGIGPGILETGRNIGAGVMSIWDPRKTTEILADWDKSNLEEKERKLAIQRQRYAEMPDGVDKWALGKMIDEFERYKHGETGEHIYKNVFEPTFGDYQPTSRLGRMFRTAVTGAAPMLVGGARPTLGAPGSGRLLGALPHAGAPVLGAGVGTLGLGAATAVGADAINEILPSNPNPALAFSFLAPWGAQAGKSIREHYAPKLDTTKVFDEASRRLSEAATAQDKAALAEQARIANEQSGLVEGQVQAGEHGPGAPQRALPTGTKTIGELTGDQGLIDLERATRTEGKPLQESGSAEAKGARDINQLQTDRAQGRVEAGKTTLDENSSPIAVAQFVEERQRVLDANVEKLGEPMPAGERGSVLQEQARETHQQYKAETKRLYDAIDPNNEFKIVTPGVKGVVEQIAGEERPGFGGAATKDVQDVMQRTSSWPQVVSFNDLTAYVKDLNLKIRETKPTATSPGDPSAHRHFTMLRDAAQKDINNAIANQAARQAELVKQGTMDWADTTAGRLAALDAQKVGPTSTVPGGPNMTTEAGARLDAARAQRAEQGRIFDNPMVRAILNASDTDVGGLPAKAFPGKTGGVDKGAETTRLVLEATKNAPEAIRALQDHAVSLVQSLGEKVQAADGTTVTRITPKSIQKFLDQYGGSLGELEKAQPGFMARFQNVANVQSELARKFIDERSGAKGGEASRAIVGDLMKDPRNGPAKLQGLLREAEAAGATDVVAGIKHLVVENMFGGALDDVAGKPTSFNGPKFLQLMRTNRALLEAAGFTPEHMRVWEAIAKDFGGQAQHENVAVKGKLRQDSGTAGNLAAIDRAFAEEKVPFKPSSLRDLSMPATFHHPWAVPFIAAADYGWNKLRHWAYAAKQAGITNRNDLIRAGIIDPDLGIAMLRRGAEDYTTPTYVSRITQALAESPYYAMPGVVEGAKEDKNSATRGKRASGGRVKLDCAGKAAELCRQADRIRRKHALDTRSILNQSDDAVADALRVASRGL